jgi:hypothetical protein
MSVAASRGLVIRADNGFKERFYVVLCDPSESGYFLMVTFTDAEKYPNPMVWTTGDRITSSWSLVKDSVLHVHTVRMRSQQWIDENFIASFGFCLPQVLEKICCNLCHFHGRIDAADKAMFERHRGAWCTEVCDQYI